VRGQTSGQGFAEPSDGERRFRELNEVLDREAMQREWATSVDQVSSCAASGHRGI